MKKNQNPPLSEEVSKNIVYVWKTSKLNSIPNISKEFGISEHQVSNAINRYLEKCLPPKR